MFRSLLVLLFMIGSIKLVNASESTTVWGDFSVNFEVANSRYEGELVNRMVFRRNEKKNFSIELISEDNPLMGESILNIDGLECRGNFALRANVPDGFRRREMKKHPVIAAIEIEKDQAGCPLQAFLELSRDLKNDKVHVVLRIRKGEPVEYDYFKGKTYYSKI